MEKRNTMTWDELVSSYAKNPRDVKTCPIRKEGVWFYVYVDNENIYVENAKYHSNSSKIKHKRVLEKDKVDIMLSIYHRRCKRESVSIEAKSITHNQVYWYGIFADMNL